MVCRHKWQGPNYLKILLASVLLTLKVWWCKGAFRKHFHHLYFYFLFLGLCKKVLVWKWNVGFYKDCHSESQVLMMLWCDFFKGSDPTVEEREYFLLGQKCFPLLKEFTEKMTRNPGHQTDLKTGWRVGTRESLKFPPTQAFLWF